MTLTWSQPTCVDLGGEFDKEAGQTTANIFPFFMVGREVGLNAVGFAPVPKTLGVM
jgi:hypothetical protein